MVNLKQELYVIDYLGAPAVFVLYLAIVFVLCVTVIMWCCIEEGDDVTVLDKVGKYEIETFSNLTLQWRIGRQKRYGLRGEGGATNAVN